jgi:hypothetical protein
MVILLGITAAFQVIGLPVQFALRTKAEQFLDGRITKSSFEDALKTQQSVTGVQGGAVIALIVLTMVWMFRLAKNHRALGRPDSTWVPGWAIGGWFVPPGVVYAVPWLMFRELWKGSDPANIRNDPNWKSRPVSPLINLWWIMYGFVPIVGAVVGLGVGFSFRDFTQDATADLAKLATKWFWLQFAVSVVAVATTCIYAKIVHDLTKRQRALTGEV